MIITSKDNETIKHIKKLKEKKYREEFDVWKNTEGKNDIVTKGRIYLDLAKNSKEFIQEFAKNYDSIRKNKTLLLTPKKDIMLTPNGNGGIFASLYNSGMLEPILPINSFVIKANFPLAAIFFNCTTVIELFPYKQNIKI